VNKKVDGQRKRKPETKHKGEKRCRNKWEGQEAKREKKNRRTTGGIITGVNLRIKEKRKE
jgi:hypothetical protein